MSTFLFTDLSNVTTTASSANEDYPTTNLLDYNNQTKWIADSITNDMWVQLSFPSAIAATMVAVDNHNFDAIMASGSIQLQYADDEPFTTNVTTVATLPTSSVDVMATTFGSVTKRYWRIYYSGECATNPHVGNIFIGTPVELPFNYSWGYKKDNKEHYTSDKIALTGTIRTSQPYQGRQVYELNCKFLTDTVRSNFATFVKSVRGKLFPFYFTDHDNTTRFVKFAEDYTPAMVERWNINQIQSLKMRGFDVGLSSAESSVVTLSDLVETEEWITTVS